MIWGLSQLGYLNQVDKSEQNRVEWQFYLNMGMSVLFSAKNPFAHL